MIPHYSSKAAFFKGYISYNKDISKESNYILNKPPYLNSFTREQKEDISTVSNIQRQSNIWESGIFPQIFHRFMLTPE